MNTLAQIQYLNGILLAEMPEYQALADGCGQGQAEQRRLLRSLMNLRPPMPLRADFLAAQDALLAAEREASGVVDGAGLPAVAADARLALWQGDITRLRVDAIVNAANSGLLGCFQPCHSCIDNVIHSAGGLQIRDDCQRLMAAQGHDEPTGQAKLTPGHNLPSRYILHTVGPIIQGPLTERDCALLASCYRSCLTLAVEKGLRTVAFCCISTGVFRFPQDRAAEIAVETVTDFLRGDSLLKKVIFDVFTDTDYALYHRLLEN